MRKLMLCCSLLLLGACSSYYSSNGEKNYLQSRNGPALNVPPPLTEANISNFYDLPTPEKNPQVSIAPPTD